MKATFLTSVFAALVLTTNVNAKNVKVYSNNESNENGTLKEFVTLDNETSKPLTKDFYEYDVNGNIQEKTTSEWKDEKGWVNSRKYEYKYGKAGKVASVTYTKWDEKVNNWSDSSDVLVHIYDENDEFLTVKQIQIENSIDNGFMTLKQIEVKMIAN